MTHAVFKKSFTELTLLRKQAVKTVFFIFLFGATAFATFLLTSHDLFAKSSEKTIVMSDEGFTPQYVSIQKGEKVTWVIEGKNRYWPASDPHPSHTQYPEKGGCIASTLDACEALWQGRRYSFVFNKTGLWNIHDHLHPGNTMIVEVNENNNGNIFHAPDSNDFRKSTHNKQQQVITKLAKDNPKKAWEYLKKTYIVNNQVIGNPHSFAHLIGNNAYDKYGLEGVRICDSKFAYGCYHGVTEQMLLHLGVSGIKKIEQSCISYWPPDKTENFTGCIHGAGHGLTTWRAYDLQKAISDCEGFSPYLRMYCYNGAMMEFMEGAPKERFDKSDPWAMCSSLKNDSHQLCARILIIPFTSMFNWSFGEIARNCPLAPNDIFKSECFLALGDHAAQSAQGDIAKIRAMCSQINDKKGVGQCYSSAAKQVVFQEYVSWEVVSRELCDEDMVDHEECEQGLEEEINVNKRRI